MSHISTHVNNRGVQVLGVDYSTTPVLEYIPQQSEVEVSKARSTRGIGTHTVALHIRRVRAANSMRVVVQLTTIFVC